MPAGQDCSFVECQTTYANTQRWGQWEIRDEPHNHLVYQKAIRHAAAEQLSYTKQPLLQDNMPLLADPEQLSMVCLHLWILFDLLGLCVLCHSASHDCFIAGAPTPAEGLVCDRNDLPEHPSPFRQWFQGNEPDWADEDHLSQHSLTGRPFSDRAESETDMDTGSMTVDGPISSKKRYYYVTVSICVLMLTAAPFAHWTASVVCKPCSYVCWAVLLHDLLPA